MEDKELKLVYPERGEIIVMQSSYDDMIIKKKVFTEDEVITILTELQQYIEENVLADDPDTLVPFLQARDTCAAVIQLKINELKGDTNGNDN